MSAGLVVAFLVGSTLGFLVAAFLIGANRVSESPEDEDRWELFQGLNEHWQRFSDADANALRPDQNTEWHTYIIEGALQSGFEMIDYNGDVFICSSRQLVDFVAPYKKLAQPEKGSCP